MPCIGNWQQWKVWHQQAVRHYFCVYIFFLIDVWTVFVILLPSCSFCGHEAETNQRKSDPASCVGVARCCWSPLPTLVSRPPAAKSLQPQSTSSIYQFLTVMSLFTESKEVQSASSAVPIGQNHKYERPPLPQQALALVYRSAQHRRCCSSFLCLDIWG